jgi:PhnB protein
MSGMPVSFKPDRFHTVTPHLSVDGADKYIEFLTTVFGAIELSRSPAPGGKLMHAEVMIGDSVVMLNDEFPEFGAPPTVKGLLPVTLHLYVEAPDALFEKAAAAGCQITMPLADQFWGDRYGQFNDPFGFRWAIAARKEELTPAQLKERSAKMFGGAPPKAG